VPLPGCGILKRMNSISINGSEDISRYMKCKARVRGTIEEL